MSVNLSKIIGHRGACGHAPENTLTSMSKAHELGVKWVEFDVKLTKCGELVIFHDSHLDRTTNGKGPVAHHDIQTIAELECGSWFSPDHAGEKIPTFKDLLKHVAALNLSINVEIKPCDGRDLETTLKTIKDLIAHWPDTLPPPLISSFSKIVIEAASQWHYPVGFLINSWETDWESVVAENNCIALHVKQTILTPEKVEKVKNKGLLLLGYTVNDSERAKELFTWGVDAVFSDYPDRLIQERL